MASGVYRIRHVASGRCYIGSACRLNIRQRDHFRSLGRGKHHSRFLQRAWNKYGESAFVFEVVLYCGRANLLFYEQRCIDGYRPDYNVTPTAGSQLGFRHSAEGKAKMSAAASRTRNFTGNHHTEESRQRIAEAKRGRKMGPYSPERIAKAAAGNIGKVRSPELRARISAALTGRKQSAETIEKRVRQLRGRKMPPGFAEATSARMRGKRMPQSVIEKMRRSKSRFNVTEVQEIRNLLRCGQRQKDIAKLFSVDPSVISELSSGKTYMWAVVADA